MLEIPESRTISLQLAKVLLNKRITEIVTATSPHKFAFYCGDPSLYAKLLVGKQVQASRGHGMFVDIYCEDNVTITIGDGTNLRYYAFNEERPEKFQLMISVDDGSCIAFTVAMYGGIWAYRDVFDNKYYQGSLKSYSPLDDAFDENCFDLIFKSTVKDISLKAILAAEQRIPGLGNGVLQDILFNAALHPKKKKSSVSDSQKTELFKSLKMTLMKMTEKGGRDTEKDLFGNIGGYKTLLSKNTVNQPCTICGGLILKQSYLGGSVYFCPMCQKL